MGKLIREIEQGDLVLIELMVYVDGEGLEKIVLKALSEIDDEVAHFHEVIKPHQPQYKNLLEQWKRGTELKKKVKASVNQAVEEADSN